MCLHTFYFDKPLTILANSSLIFDRLSRGASNASGVNGLNKIMSRHVEYTRFIHFNSNSPSHHQVLISGVASCSPGHGNVVP